MLEIVCSIKILSSDLQCNNIMHTNSSQLAKPPGYKYIFYFTTLLSGFLFFGIYANAVAQTCGSITDLGGIEKGITDCTNPFGVSPSPSPVNLYINNERVAEGDSLVLPSTSTNQYRIDWSGGYFNFRIGAYLHTPEG